MIEKSAEAAAAAKACFEAIVDVFNTHALPHDDELDVMTNLLVGVVIALDIPKHQLLNVVSECYDIHKTEGSPLSRKLNH